MEAHPLSPRDFFEPARQQFHELIADLQRPEAFELQEARIEELVLDRGREVLRTLLQSFFDSRTKDRPLGPVVGQEGTERTHRRPEVGRDLQTQTGPVIVERESFGKPGHGSLRPLDAALNLPPTLYSLPLGKLVAEQVAHTSFEQAQTTVEKQTGVTIGLRQMEEEAQRAAVDFQAFYEQRQQKPLPSGSSRPLRSHTGGLLILSADGKGVVMRTHDLREETRKKAEAAAKEKKRRLSPGEKRDRKRMAEVAAVYTIEPLVRTSADIVREGRAVQDATRVRPKPENKRVWASLTQGIDEVIAEQFEEADWRDPERRKRWVALVDGNKTQIAAYEREAKERGIELFLLVDIIHVLEYLWKAALPLHRGARDEAERWVTDHLLALLEGDSRNVAAGLRRSATLRGLSAKERVAVDDCADYLRDYAPYLRYAEALAAGFPIATGVIEGACRHLVQDRMDITGARWCLASAEAVLRLRALQSSGDWEEYWRFHEQKEYERNHAARYANQKPPVMTSPGKSRLRLVK
jgi:hypothetical protein